MRCAAPVQAMRRSLRPAAGLPRRSRRTAAASDDELLDQSRRRLHALMRGGCTTVEIKSGYGLDPASELRLLKIAGELGEGEAVRIVPTLLALHALPADQRDRRAHYVSEIVDKLIPAAAKQGSRPASTPFAKPSPSRPKRSSACSRRRRTMVSASAFTPSNCRTSTVPHLPHDIARLSADHLEHLDEAGAKAMAAAGTVAVLLPGAFYALQEEAQAAGGAAAQAQGADRGRDRLQPRHLAAAVADAGDEHGLHFVRSDAGGGAGRHDHQRRARARACARRRQHRRRQAGGPVRLAHRIPRRARLLDRPAGTGAAHLRGAAMRSAAAALVAIICWSGLAIQFSATFANQHHVVATLWVLLRFFTVITNLIVAVAMTSRPLASGCRRSRLAERRFRSCWSASST